MCVRVWHSGDNPKTGWFVEKEFRRYNDVTGDDELDYLYFSCPDAYTASVTAFEVIDTDEWNETADGAPGLTLDEQVFYAPSSAEYDIYYACMADKYFADEDGMTPAEREFIESNQDIDLLRECWMDTHRWYDDDDDAQSDDDDAQSDGDEKRDEGSENDLYVWMLGHHRYDVVDEDVVF